MSREPLKVLRVTVNGKVVIDNVPEQKEIDPEIAKHMKSFVEKSGKEKPRRKNRK